MIRVRLWVVAAAFAAVAQSQPSLSDASLEQLLDTRVTSVSKKEQKLSRTAAAVFVISQEDIRRSGAQTVPDVLRMVPGVEVAQIDANAWAITIRGFNSRYSSKLLVLINGRSVYTPTFSGVYWDQIDIPLEFIERVEVIRGPGATVWGANAVNGVINIITSPAKATQGGTASIAAGSGIQPGILSAYGGSIGRAGTYRAFMRYSRFANNHLESGASAADGWDRRHAGFRSDWTLSPNDSLSVEGDAFSNTGGQTRYRWFIRSPFDAPFFERLDSAGGNLAASWEHVSSGGSETSVRAYFDAYRRSDVASIEIQRETDLQFQNHFTAGSRHDVVWGFGFRNTRSGVPPGYPVQLSPPLETARLYNVFLQDEIQLGHDVWLTAGTKVEHNNITGFEFEPSLRLAWTPAPRQTFWAAASRAIRQPSRQEASIQVDILAYPLDANTLLTTRLSGNPRLRSEELRDFGAGYRTAWSNRVSLDLDAFLSYYRNLETVEVRPMVISMASFPVQVVVPNMYGNLGRATNYGGEASFQFAVTPRWRLSPGVSFLRMNYRNVAGSTDVLGEANARDVPGQSLNLRSQFNVSRRVQWDQSLYWNASLMNGAVPQHTRLDSRISWKHGEHAEFGVVGQNLLTPRFTEFRYTLQLAPGQAQRGVFGTITWTF